jgi:exosortase/archaeosortase family protein
MAMLSKLTRHARACRGHPRLSFFAKNKDVDGRDISAFTRVFRRARPSHDVERLSQNNIDTIYPFLVAMLVMAATWDAWRWYVQRVWESPEEAASLALTVVFLGAFGVTRRSKESVRLPLLPVTLLLAAFAVSYAMLPPIARAAIAIAATLFCGHLAAFKERPPVAFWGLVALALPVVPSFQFVLGYPMRLVCAALSVGLLQVHGLAVERKGTFLVWRDELLQFDAPCSGVNMLWAGLLLTLMGCVLFRFNTIKVMIAVALSLVLAIVCNVLRATSLFYVEAGLLPHAQAWWHEGIGIAAFTVSAAVTLWLLTRLRGREVVRCVS